MHNFYSESNSFNEMYEFSTKKTDVYISTEKLSFNEMDEFSTSKTHVYKHRFYKVKISNLSLISQTPPSNKRLLP